MNILFIIGNGFDKAHGIESSYGDFKTWVHSEHGIAFSAEVAQVESFFNANGELWADFETNLGHYNVDKIAAQRFGIFPFVIIEYDVNENNKIQIIGNSMPYIESLSEALQSIFRKWIFSLDTRKPQKYSLNKEAYYLTFNYTDTLERVYGIPDKNILHIHGSILTKDKSLVLGHNNYIDPMSVTIEGNDMRDNNERIDRICEMNNLIKPCLNIIERNTSFFRKLNDITDIWVYGHSYNEIDLPYFQKIKQSIHPNTMWHMGWHTEDDLNHLMNYKKVLDINNKHLETFHN